MSSHSEIMNEQIWQPVPGHNGAELLAFINNADYFLSNAYLFNMDGAFVVVDPGDSSAQIQMISAAIEAINQPDKPIIVILTHAHVDHCFEFLYHPERIAMGHPLTIMMQEEGIKAIKNKDRELTGAGRFKKIIPETIPDIALFKVNDRLADTSTQAAISENFTVNLMSYRLQTPEDDPLFVQKCGGSGFKFLIYYAPGHSPDSVVVRVGDLLMTGDAMLAAEHFIAGLPGWNKNDSIKTAKNLLWVLENTGVSAIGTGHGNMLTPKQAEVKLQKMIQKLIPLEIQLTFTLPFILSSSKHALDIANEARDLISTMAGSLNQAAYYLALLEEEQEANRFVSAINQEKVTALFSAFNEITEAMHAGKLLEMVMVHGSSTLFWKMRLLIKTFELDVIVNQSLFNRLERMLTDFYDETSGLTIALKEERFQLGPWLQNLVTNLSKDHHSEENIFDVLDDEKAFVQALSRRIASRHIYRDVTINVAADDGIWVETDPDRFAECLEILIENLIESGNVRIDIRVMKEHTDEIGVAMRAERIDPLLLEDGYRQHALTRRLTWLEGRLVVEVLDVGFQVGCYLHF